MELFAGSSGFSYKEWKGPFYPEKHPDKQMFAYYSERLRTVEINNTFYRMPRSEMIAKWVETAPEHFRFVFKASRRITHSAKLGEESFDSVRYLWSKLEPYQERLGPVLFQTPPYLKKDLALLQAFVAELPDGMRAAFEFRSRTWFEDDVYEVLRAAGAALAVADWEEESKTAPLVRTADFAFMRLRKDSYDDAELGAWLKQLKEKGFDEAYVFFKHEDDGAAPKLAMRMQSLAKG